MGDTLLQIFLLVNVAIVGALVTVGIQHAYAHFRPGGKKSAGPDRSAHLPPAVREKILQTAQTKFQHMLNKSADELQGDLESTSSKLNKQLEQLGTNIINSEMKRYRESIDDMQKQAENSIGAANSEMAKHQQEIQAKLEERRNELETKLNEEIASERSRVTQQIDEKLTDAVTAFLVDTLQHEVDLGAQSKYLTAMLEEHKEELKKEIADEQ